ncbi:MAG: anthranilate synthase component I [Cyanobacteria bacterium J06553_1]
MKPFSITPCQQYFWRSRPLAHLTGSDVFARLFQPQTVKETLKATPAGIATLLESPYPLPSESLPDAARPMARYSICAGAPRVTEGVPQLWTPPVGQILPLLAQLGSLRQSVSESPDSSADGVVPDENLPFVGGWLGWLGYDLAWEIEQLPWLKEDALPFPVAFWYEPANFAVLDHQAQRLWLAAETMASLAGMDRQISAVSSMPRDSALAGSNATGSDRPMSTSSIYIDKPNIDRPLKFETEQADFEQAVSQAKAHICAGDVFQVNHSLRFQTQTNSSSWEVYQKLHRINPSPFASYWHTPWGSVVSCSPERLVHLNAGVAQSRPIAGTRPRGKSQAEDSAIAQELLSDPKERAEHIMLVDLERNDLGRVCHWGSVQVNELMSIERYSHVMHLVSNVVGQFPVEGSAAQLIAALFPGGTITGCPKVRCMEIIETLEPVRRSLFYGSCGYFDKRGRLDLNILIRTLLMAPTLSASSSEGLPSVGPSQTVWGQVGAGIVADSQPTKEWLESLQKAKAQLLALGL